MKISLVVSLVALVLISACGLQYTPTETREDLSQKRKNAVSQYIRDSYKDSSVVYQSLVFAPSTLIKPYHHRLLDSLYEIKFENEQSGRFDKDLEEKINNQKNVIANSKEKTTENETYVLPVLKADYQLMDGIKLYAGYEGDVMANNLTTILQENQWSKPCIFSMRNPFSWIEKNSCSATIRLFAWRNANLPS